MDKYKIISPAGAGTYASVYKAMNKETHEYVAIKIMKREFPSWTACMELRELKSLRKMSHPNVVKLKEVIKIENQLHFVFEYLSHNVHELAKAHPQGLPESTIRSLLYQALMGLAYVHKMGYFHRDMKPENLLVENEVLKIADFGIAREIKSNSPMTDYVSTRWYRAPELLLRSTRYNWPIDIFALGAIMGELYLQHPLFPGSSEQDQLLKICTILGTPPLTTWPDGYRLASHLGYSFPLCSPVPLPSLLPNASPSAINLLTDMLSFDPNKRPTASQCLQHSYFQSLRPLSKLPPLQDHSPEPRKSSALLPQIAVRDPAREVSREKSRRAHARYGSREVQLQKVNPGKERPDNSHDYDYDYDDNSQQHIRQSSIATMHMRQSQNESLQVKIRNCYHSNPREETKSNITHFLAQHAKGQAQRTEQIRQHCQDYHSQQQSFDQNDCHKQEESTAIPYPLKDLNTDNKATWVTKTIAQPSNPSPYHNLPYLLHKPVPEQAPMQKVKKERQTQGSAYFAKCVND